MGNKKRNVIAPTIHRNGTSADDIQEQLQKAYRAVNEASKALSAAYPNARDYYVQGNEAFPKARREWDERQAKLKSVADDLLAIHIAIDEQGGD